MIGAVLLFGIYFPFAAATTVQSHICQLPHAPIIIQPSSDVQVSQPHVTVQGTADANTSITIVDNGENTAAVTTDSAGNFEVDVPLVSQQNQLQARASNLCNDTASSGTVTVTYIPPPIPPPPTPAPSSTPITNGQSTIVNTGAVNGSSTTITSGNTAGSSSPSQTAISGPLVLYVQTSARTVTTRPSIVMTGLTNVFATITIFVNGKQVASVRTDSNGYFRIRAPLTIGENDLTISATAQNQVATVHVAVTRQAFASPKEESFWQRYGMFLISALIVVLAGLIALIIARRRRSS